MKTLPFSRRPRRLGGEDPLRDAGNDLRTLINFLVIFIRMMFRRTHATPPLGKGAKTLQNPPHNMSGRGRSPIQSLSSSQPIAITFSDDMAVASTRLCHGGIPRCPKTGNVESIERDAASITAGYFKDDRCTGHSHGGVRFRSEGTPHDRNGVSTYVRAYPQADVRDQKPASKKKDRSLQQWTMIRICELPDSYPRCAKADAGRQTHGQLMTKSTYQLPYLFWLWEFPG